jgi:hypothetical protein
MFVTRLYESEYFFLFGVVFREIEINCGNYYYWVFFAVVSENVTCCFPNVSTFSVCHALSSRACHPRVNYEKRGHFEFLKYFFVDSANSSTFKCYFSKNTHRRLI